MNKGYLECNEKFINLEKAGPTYLWVLEKMNKNIPNENNTKYPLWCWVKFENGICPPKHKGEPVTGFDVKITSKKDKKEIFITDFRRYSFLLNNIFIPSNKSEKEKFDQLLQKYSITNEDLKAYDLNICEKIRKSFDKCITTDSDVLQGCIWRINLNEVEKIEFLNDTNHRYGSFNYIRSNGKWFDWIKDYYKNLK